MQSPSSSIDVNGSNGVTSTLVWDLPVRLFHWLLVLCFAGAWVTAESERVHLIHITLGYTVGGLVAFRLVWGWVGTGPARFASFVRGPGAVLGYLRSMVSGRPEHHVGHNPAGAWAIVAILGLAAATVALGWATETERLPAALEKAHEIVATLWMVVVGIHVGGVILGSLMHRENLPRSMVTGRKLAKPEEGIRRSAWPVALVLLAGVAGFWSWQWQTAPDGAMSSALQALASGQLEHDHADHEHDD